MSGLDLLKAGSGVFSDHNFCAQEMKASTVSSFSGHQSFADLLQVLTMTLLAVALLSLSMGLLPLAFLFHRLLHLMMMAVLLQRVLQLLSLMKALLLYRLHLLLMALLMTKFLATDGPIPCSWALPLLLNEQHLNTFFSLPIHRWNLSHLCHMSMTKMSLSRTSGPSMAVAVT